MRTLLLVAVVIAGCATSRGMSDECPRPAAALSSHTSLKAEPLKGIDKMRIENELSACTTVEARDLYALGNVAVGDFRVRDLQSRGACGCMSSLIAYSVVEKRMVSPEEQELGETGEIERLRGVVQPGRDSATLVVATDLRLLDAALTLRLQCMGPD